MGVDGVRRGRRERGAALIEFALIMPLLLMLLIGIIEFAWLFSQNLNVRHGAREGARLIAVNYNPNANSGAAQTTDIVTETCNRMDTVTGATVTITGQGGDIGDPAAVEVSAPGTTLTGFLDWAIPSGLMLISDIEIRLEQPPTWQDTPMEACP